MEKMKNKEGRFWIEKSFKLPLNGCRVIYDIETLKPLPPEFDDELFKLVNKYMK